MELPEGYSLREDDHILFLLYKDHVVAAFSSSKADEKEILTEIANRLAAGGH